MGKVSDYRILFLLIGLALVACFVLALFGLVRWDIFAGAFIGAALSQLIIWGLK